METRHVEPFDDASGCIHRCVLMAAIDAAEGGDVHRGAPAFADEVQLLFYVQPYLRRAPDYLPT